METPRKIVIPVGTKVRVKDSIHVRAINKRAIGFEFILSEPLLEKKVVVSPCNKYRINYTEVDLEIVEELIDNYEIY